MTQLTDPTVAPVVPADVEDLPEVVLGSLSPSRAADFKACPLLYRFRCVDRLPQTPSPAATRGTLVHSVLEDLFELPAPERTLAAARDMLPAAWQRLRAEVPAVESLFAADDTGADLAAWLQSAAELVGNYFRLEDPARLEPASREQRVEVVIDGVRLRGVIDRLDVSAAGDVRVVDYKPARRRGRRSRARRCSR